MKSRLAGWRPGGRRPRAGAPHEVDCPDRWTGAVVAITVFEAANAGKRLTWDEVVAVTVFLAGIAMALFEGRSQRLRALLQTPSINNPRIAKTISVSGPSDQLFIPQGFNRVQPACTAGGIVAEEHADSRREEKRQYGRQKRDFVRPFLPA